MKAAWQGRRFAAKAFAAIVFVAVLVGAGGGLAYSIASGPTEWVYEECWDVADRRTVCQPLDEPYKETHRDKVVGGVMMGIVVGGSFAYFASLFAHNCAIALLYGGPVAVFHLGRPLAMFVAVAAVPFGGLFLGLGWNEGDYRVPIGIGLLTYSGVVLGLWLLSKAIWRNTSFLGGVTDARVRRILDGLDD